MNQEYQKFNLQDVAEITIGSVLLAFPIAVTEEVWVISEELPIGRTLLISFVSIMFIAFFGYYLFYRSYAKTRLPEFVLRVITVYVITLLISGFILLAIDKFPIMTDPIVAIKRTIIVALPASFSATIIDSLHTARQQE